MADDLNFVKPDSLTDRIHDRILEMIIMTPDEDQLILNEKRLQEKFGCSKAPVREALIKLCGEGVLNNIPRVGYMVVRLNDSDMKDVHQLRSYLEEEHIRKIAGKLTQTELDAIEQQIRRAGAKQNVDICEIWNDNEEFHLLLSEFAGNRITKRIFEDCLSIEKRSFAQKHWRTMNSLVDSVDSTSHLSIYEALKQGNLERALAAIRADMESFPQFS